MLMLRCCCAKAAREHGTLLSRVKPNLIQIGVELQVGGSLPLPSVGRPMRSMGGRGSGRSYGACIARGMLMLRCCCAKAACEHGTLLSRVKPNLIQIAQTSSQLFLLLVTSVTLGDRFPLFCDLTQTFGGVCLLLNRFSHRIGQYAHVFALP